MRIEGSMVLLLPALLSSGCVRQMLKEVLKDEISEQKKELHLRYLSDHADYEKDGQPIPAASWRTPEIGREAHLRAQSALQAHCGKLDEAASSPRVLVSEWEKTGRRNSFTRLWLRCSVRLVPETQESGSELIATFAVADCPRLKLTDDAIANAHISSSEVEARCKLIAAIPAAMVSFTKTEHPSVSEKKSLK